MARADSVKKALKAEYAPDVLTAWRVFLALQVSAVYNYISDCDETFNYWEPVHFMQFGFGLQTWEYSPAYALRSYLFLFPISLLGRFLDYMETYKSFQFYAMRLALGIFTAACQTQFYLQVKRFFRPRVAFIMLLFMFVSPGMFVAGTALLPSSFAMNCVMLACSQWLKSKPSYPLAIAAIGVGAILGWPFAALAGVPLFISSLSEFGFMRTIAMSIVTAVGVSVPSVVFDSAYYGYWTFPTWNILMYNVFSVTGGTGGSDLYGTEPWYWYVENLALNYNVIFLFAIIAIPLCLLSPSMKVRVRSFKKTIGLLSIVLLWVGFFSLIPHKEERFMFVIFGPLALAGAIGFVAAFDILFSFLSLCCSEGFSSRVVGFFALFLSTSILLLSCSRTYSIIHNYQAPLVVYGELHSSILGGDDCYPSFQRSQEWYRYPSSYFLPGNRFNLTFIDHGPTSQLPQPYPSSAHELSPNFNDQNREEPSRLVPLDTCSFIIDYDPEGLSGSQRHSFRTLLVQLTLQSALWRRIRESIQHYLSRKITISFFVPFMSHYLAYGSYQIWARKHVWERRVENCKGLVYNFSVIVDEPLVHDDHPSLPSTDSTGSLDDENDSQVAAEVIHDVKESANGDEQSSSLPPIMNEDEIAPPAASQDETEPTDIDANEAVNQDVGMDQNDESDEREDL